MKKVLVFSFLGVTLLVIILFMLSMFLFPVSYKDDIKNYANKYGLSPALVASVINVESRFKIDAKSDAGAIGLMQILPSTANEIAHKLKKSSYSLDDKNTNIEFGCYYLKYLLNRYDNDLTNALCAYNAGPTNVDNWLKEQGGTLHLIPFKETKNYIKKINYNLKVYNVKYR